jgi:Subtilase family/PKD domain
MRIFMVRKAAITALLLSLIATGTFARVPDDPSVTPKPFIIPGRVTVVFNDNVDLSKARVGFGRVNFNLPSLDNVLDQYQVNESRRIFTDNVKTSSKTLSANVPDLSRFYELAFPESTPVPTIISALRQNPNIKLVEPVWALPLYAAPNDPQYTSQWSLRAPGPDPVFYTGWDYETGSDSIKYAAIDSGVKYAHSDLNGNIWVNPGEDMDNDEVVYDTDDLNGVDDDGNGYIDDVIGYDFFNGIGGVWPGEDPGAPDTDPDDFDGHGTHISGIAAAATNNALNGAGIAGGWYGGHRAKRGARIMCLRVGATGTDGLGYVNSNDCGTAIQYAVNNGAHVINCSWGSTATGTMTAGMALVAANGLTICHAAGNENLDDSDYLDSDPSTTVLSVASVGPSSDVKSGFSNFGFWIDVSAPGSDIFNTYSNDGVATMASLSGTSMAAPTVCGLALLIRSAKPSLTKDQVDSIIITTADDIDGVNPSHVGMLGSGRINALTALSGLPIAKFSPDKTAGNVPLTVNFTDLTVGSPTAWDWSFGDAGTSTLQNPSHLYSAAGVYDVSLLANTGHGLGLAEEHLLDYIWVRADTCKMDSVQTTVGSAVTVPIYMTNTQLVKEIQFTFQLQCTEGTVDSFKYNTTGLRTSYFPSLALNAFDPGGQSYGILMKSSPTGGSNYLTAGNGAILNLVLYISGAASNQVITIDTVTTGGKNPRVSTIYGDYWPLMKTGKVNIGGCCVIDGNANHIGGINVSDVTFLVKYLFAGGPPPPCLDEGNTNDLGGINVSDVTYLVKYLFQSGPPPPGGCP